MPIAKGLTLSIYSLFIKELDFNSLRFINVGGRKKNRCVKFKQYQFNILPTESGNIMM